MNTRSKLLVFLVMALAVGACVSSGQGDADEAGQAATVGTATQENLTFTSTATEQASLLPFPLYYLSDADGGENFQVWRLERDGVTQRQSTAEAAPVASYDVSPLDGSVAYVVGNQLYFVGADEGERRLLVDGGPEEATDQYYYERAIDAPRWSPDGRTLAYGRGGVNLYDMETGAVTKLLENRIEIVESGATFPEALYFPEAWSPDGAHLLVAIRYLESSGLGVMDVSSGELVVFGSGVVWGFRPRWVDEGSAVIIASPYLGLSASGLWRYDAASGAETALIPTTSDEGTLNFVGWANQTLDGGLVYFYTNTPTIPEGEVALSMVRSAADGVTDRTQLRPEAFQISDAIWAPDGSLAVVVQLPPGTLGWPLRGPVLLVPADGGPIRPLVTSGYDLRWGP